MSMEISSAVRQFAQLCFEFIEGQHPPGDRDHSAPAEASHRETAADDEGRPEAHAEPEDDDGDDPLRAGRDDDLEGDCRQMLLNLGIKTVSTFR